MNFASVTPFRPVGPIIRPQPNGEKLPFSLRARENGEGKTTFGERFNPESYCLIVWPYCHRSGRPLDDLREVDV